MPDKEAGKPVPKPVNLKDEVVPYIRGTWGSWIRKLTLTAIIRHLVGDDTAYFTAKPGDEPPTDRHGRRQGRRFCSRAATIWLVTCSRISVWLAGIVASSDTRPLYRWTSQGFPPLSRGAAGYIPADKVAFETATGSQVA